VVLTTIRVECLTLPMANDLLNHVTEDLQELCRARSPSDLRRRPLPFLRDFAIAVGGPDSNPDHGVEALITAAISRMPDQDYRRAAQTLLGDTPERWTALRERARRSAAVFDLGYDAFRRRGKGRPSRLDDVLAQVAESILVVVGDLNHRIETNQQRAAIEQVLPWPTDPWSEDVPEPAAFISYVQADDQHDGGYVTDLRKRLMAEVRVQTGEEFVIFQDRDDILWGQRWKRTIDNSLDSTTLLIAILTPSFLKSEACRSEVTRFLEREAQLGRDDLILSVYYVDTPQLGDPTDPIARELMSRQYFDWRDLRFEPFSDPRIRKQIAKLAQQMVQSLTRDVSALTLAPVSPTGAEQEDEERGFLELVAQSEEAMPAFAETTETFAHELQEMSSRIVLATTDMEAANASPKPAAAKLAVAKRLASDLREPAGVMEDLAEEYVEQLARVDGGISAIASAIPRLTSEDEVESLRGLHAALATLSAQGKENVQSLSAMTEAISITAKLSSTLRPVLRRITAAANRTSAGPEHFRRWEEVISEGLNALQAADR
jgi:hypothetical protein